MKRRLLILALVLVFACSAALLVACKDTSLDKAKAALEEQYANYTKLTSGEAYELAGSIDVEGKTYTITWTSNADSTKVAIAEKAGGGYMVTVTKGDAKLDYTLTATIANAKGETVTATFSCSIPANTQQPDNPSKTDLTPVATALTAQYATNSFSNGTNYNVVDKITVANVEYTLTWSVAGAGKSQVTVSGTSVTVVKGDAAVAYQLVAKITDPKDATNTKNVVFNATIPAQGSVTPPSTPGDGSLEHPYTAAEAVAEIKGWASGKTVSDSPVYVKGVVAAAQSADFSAVTAKDGYYWFNLEGDSDNNLDIYYAKSNIAPVAGDEVIVFGYLKLFTNSSETPAKVKYEMDIVNNVALVLTSVKGQATDCVANSPAGAVVADAEKGGKNNPYTVAETLALDIAAGAFSDKMIYVQGYVTSISYSNKYDNYSIYIADTVNGTPKIQCYGTGINPNVVVPAKNDKIVVLGFIENRQFTSNTEKQLSGKAPGKAYPSVISRTAGEPVDDPTVSVTSPATMQYTGSATTNMSDTGNNAQIVGLNPTIFTISSNKNEGDFPNAIGLNKDGTIRMYGSSTQGNILTIAVKDGMYISKISLHIASGSSDGAKLVVGAHPEFSPAKGQTYTDVVINSQTVTLETKGTAQIRFDKIVIYFEEGTAPTDGDTTGVIGGGEEPEQPDPITSKVTKVASIDALQEDVAYRLVADHAGINKQVYMKGEMSGFYVAITDQIFDAADIYIEKVDSGIKLYFLDGTTRKYICGEKSGEHLNIKFLDTLPTEGFVWTMSEKGLSTTHSSTAIYIGCNGTYNNMGAYDESVSYAAYLATINEDVKAATIVAENDDHATINLSATTGKVGETFTFTVTHDTGYSINISINGKNEGYELSGDTYTVKITANTMTVKVVAIEGSKTLTTVTTGDLKGAAVANWDFSHSSWYSGSGYKLNKLNYSITSPKLTGATGKVTVKLKINALNQKQTSNTPEHCFKIELLGSDNSVIQTGYIDTVKTGEDNSVTIDAGSSAVAKVKITFVGFPNDGSKECNVNLGKVTIEYYA